jgi:hypothetical protein
VSTEILAGKTWKELKAIHDQAIVDEDRAKRTLHILRQRAANMPSDAEALTEAISDAVTDVVTTTEWLLKVEQVLSGTPRDIYGEKYGRK